MGRRALAIGLSLLIAAILLFMLLSFGVGRRPPREEERVTVVNFSASEASGAAPKPSEQKREQAKEQTTPQPTTEESSPPRPTDPLPPPPVAPAAAPTQPTPDTRPPAPTTPKIGVRIREGQSYGPPNTGGSSASGDTAVVGTAPNGEPLYAAAWYREPSDDELRGYLSTASGPGWGLVACRTAPDYRVEDCVGLDEFPNGSQITRAVLAAAWQFRVRPPRRGGKPLVGAWVRIRIDYGIKRR